MEYEKYYTLSRQEKDQLPAMTWDEFMEIVRWAWSSEGRVFRASEDAYSPTGLREHAGGDVWIRCCDSDGSGAERVPACVTGVPAC